MTMNTTLPTEFAPAKRATMEEIQRQAALIARQPLLGTLLNSVLNYMLVLNAQRQIVFASKNVAKLLPLSVSNALGLRLGEALGCIQSHTLEGGCGTTKFCAECGAAQAILASLGGREDCQECHMVRIVGTGKSSLDLLVSAKPMEIEGELFALLAIADISHEKRRRALERIFFHDVINTTGGLQGLTAMMAEDAPVELREDIQFINMGLQCVMDEILAQRDLLAAETGELSVQLQPLNVQKVLGDTARLYEKYPVAAGRHLRLEMAPTMLDIVTDARLLQRVAGNLIKNAMEASDAGQTVTMGCEEDG